MQGGNRARNQDSSQPLLRDRPRAGRGFQRRPDSRRPRLPPFGVHSPVLNKRKDRWGGPLENRMRIVTEILSRARSEVGTFPILVKISAHDEFRRGLTGDDAIAIAQLLQQNSCDAIEVSCGYGNFFHRCACPRCP